MNSFWSKHKSWLKPILIMISMVVFVLVYWRLDGQERLELYVVENTPMNTREFLDVFEGNSLVACQEQTTNKYKIDQEECIRLIRRHSSDCKAQASEKFVGKANTVERMLLISNFYTTCIFDRKAEKK